VSDRSAATATAADASIETRMNARWRLLVGAPQTIRFALILRRFGTSAVRVEWMPPTRPRVDEVGRAAIRESFFFLIDDIHDRAAGRPDEQLAKVVLGGVGVYFDGFVQCDAVNAEISLPCGDRARYLESGCRVRVFLAIAWI
jgi:hypothetical protein